MLFKKICFMAKAAASRLPDVHLMLQSLRKKRGTKKRSLHMLAFRVFLAAAVCPVLAAVGINLYMIRYASPYIYRDVAALPGRYTVIVPGAKVYQHTVSHVVRDRIEAAVTCIKSGKAERMLLSGDHGRTSYDEVNRMKDFAHDVYAVDEDILFTDHAGFSTYETMCRARDVFCVHGAIVATQQFHCVRCVYIARKLGLDAVALVAPEVQPYRSALKTNWTVRECLARVKSFFLVLLNVPPTYLGEQIPITGSAAATWD